MYEFNFENAQFTYEPYPICYIPNLFDKVEYELLRSNYPDISLFEHKPALGGKYSLSEINNGEQYHDFLKKNKVWKDFYSKVKNKRFIEDVLKFLKANNIDLGIKKFTYVPKARQKRVLRLVKLPQKRVSLSSRFEFSIMKANGGHIVPHTDAPNKIITLIISMIGDNEWDSSWGGGTDILLPKDRSLIYNYMNKTMPFDKMDYIQTLPFNPNQMVFFVKTYNSWHSVTPMTGPATGLRKVLTVNIERVG